MMKIYGMHNGWPPDLDTPAMCFEVIEIEYLVVMAQIETVISVNLTEGPPLWYYMLHTMLTINPFHMNIKCLRRPKQKANHNLWYIKMDIKCLRRPKHVAKHSL